MLAEYSKIQKNYQVTYSCVQTHKQLTDIITKCTEIEMYKKLFSALK